MKRAISGSTPAGSYSPGIVAQGALLFVSGQSARRDGVLIEGDIEEQTRQALQNVGDVLRAAGADYSNVVRCGVFLADLDDFEAMDGVYAQFFPDPLPTRTTVGATLPPMMKVEIEAVAVVQDV
jgi:2-iminobutanoate/2-iminopropanoate deaminase